MHRRKRIRPEMPPHRLSEASAVLDGLVHLLLHLSGFGHDGVEPRGGHAVRVEVALHRQQLQLCTCELLCDALDRLIVLCLVGEPGRLARRERDAELLKLHFLALQLQLRLGHRRERLRNAALLLVCLQLCHVAFELLALGLQSSFEIVRGRHAVATRAAQRVRAVRAGAASPHAKMRFGAVSVNQIVAQPRLLPFKLVHQGTGRLGRAQHRRDAVVIGARQRLRGLGAVLLTQHLEHRLFVASVLAEQEVDVR
mmetsp:Transcript_24286/g.75200  ORF Transcript_24286/g.75200 Transcript_24286/m.75200 type:complete len:254 (-) Transcript_24286:109-870(-)